MTARAALAALVLLASAPAGAQVVYLGRADGSAGWTTPAYGPTTDRAPVNATYEAGVCGDATRLPMAGNGYAVVEAKGT